MSEEPDDFEGPWPKGDAMSEWKLVPVEPAPSQVASGEYEVPDPLSHRAANVARNVYRAMLDAAPAAPQQAEPVAWPAGHRWARNMAALESQSESDPTAPIIAPQRAELVVARKWLRLTPEELVVIWQNNDWQNHSDANLSDLIQDALIHKNEGSGGASAELANLRAEVEALKATLTQQCKGYRADVEKLEAEVEALRADALKQVDCRQCKHATNRGCHSTALCERGELFEATPPWQFYDAARAAQGERG